MSSGSTRLEFEGTIAIVTLDNVARRNAIDLEMAHGLADAASSLAGRGDFAVIVIRGAGDKAFSAGIDVKYADATGDCPAAFLAIDTQLERAAEAFDRIPVPIIALLRGACIGGGNIVAAWADIRIGSSDLTLSIPALANRLLYPADSLRRIVALIGSSRLKRLIFEGLPVPPQELREWGLIDYLFDAETFEREAMGVIRRIADQPIDILQRYTSCLATLNTKT